MVLGGGCGRRLGSWRRGVGRRGFVGEGWFWCHCSRRPQPETWKAFNKLRFSGILVGQWGFSRVRTLNSVLVRAIARVNGGVGMWSVSLVSRIPRPAETVPKLEHGPPTTVQYAITGLGGNAFTSDFPFHSHFKPLETSFVRCLTFTTPQIPQPQSRLGSGPFVPITRVFLQSPVACFRCIPRFLLSSELGNGRLPPPSSAAAHTPFFNSCWPTCRWGQLAFLPESPASVPCRASFADPNLRSTKRRSRPEGCQYRQRPRERFLAVAMTVVPDAAVPVWVYDDCVVVQVDNGAVVDGPPLSAAPVGV